MQAQHLAADAESAAILTRGRRCWLAAVLWLSGDPGKAAAEAEARLAAALLTEAETAARIGAWLQSRSENGS